MKSKFNICILNSPGKLPSFESYREVAETVKYGLQSLGHDVLLTRHQILSDCINIIFGFQILKTSMVPVLSGSTIFYNLEKMSHDYPVQFCRYQPILYEIKSSIPVWDYNLENCRRLHQLGITNVSHMPIGYMPEMSRIQPAEQDIDVLFYGGVTKRREIVLNNLRDAGLNVKLLYNIWGTERDAYIARSKVVLNMHSGLIRNTFEIVRVSYLLANSKAVVSEYSADTIIEEDILGACLFADYNNLVPACIELVTDNEKRRYYENMGFSVISSRDESIFLGNVLSMTLPFMKI